MKKYMRIGLISFFLSLMLVGGITLHTILSLQSFSRLINYVGIVRGATQRLVKLELSGTRNDEMISYLDGILEELLTGSGPYGLIQPDDQDYQRNLQLLNQSWLSLKEDIYVMRKDPSRQKQLIEDSEDYFDLANNTVFSADVYSNHQTSFLLRLIIVMSAGMLITWIIIFIAYKKHLFHLEKNYQNLENLASRDRLTGTYNLDKFMNEAELLIKQNPNLKYSFVYVDFADFKYINDVFGYAFGDDILCRYAQLNQESLSAVEVMGRVSADNFVILRCYETKDGLLLSQQKVDQQIIESCSQPLSVNCGFCCVEDVIEDLDVSGLLTRANYARKTVKNGTNRSYAFYDEGIRSQLRLEKNIESRLKTAIENHEFIVYYQPKVSVKTEQIACAEALVRWRSEDGSIVRPDLFIPVLEKNHQIARLDQYVFEEVCRWQQKCLKTGRRALPVSINVSRLQFYDAGFVDTYTRIRDHYQIPAELLEIEFTESIAFDNTLLLFKTLQDLKDAGFYISVDDFGKGYSSLSLLKQVPIDELKLDRLFFMDGDDREKDRLVVKGIVKMAESLGIHTVAEGIEEKAQQAFLKEIGCDLIQGYAYYRPMPESEYEKMLAEGK